MFNLEATFGERLKTERLRLNLTQEELATKMNVRPLTIIQYEKGKSSPAVKFIYALQDIGFDLAYLMTGTTNPYSIELSQEIIKEVAHMVDKIEHEIIDQPLNNEAKVKLILLMLGQCAKTAKDQATIPFSFQLILEKLSHYN